VIIVEEKRRSPAVPDAQTSVISSGTCNRIEHERTVDGDANSTCNSHNDSGGAAHECEQAAGNRKTSEATAR
jgi:hypothetical protein